MAFPNKPIAHLLGSNGPIHAVTYSASPGTYILTGSGDRSIRLYNPGSTAAAAATTAAGAGSSITAKQQLGATLAAGAIPEGRLIQTYAQHGYEVLSLAVAGDNARFASGGGDRAVLLWDVATAQTLARLGGNAHGHSARVNAVAFGGAGDALVVSGGLDTSVRVWDTRQQSGPGGGGGGGRPVQVLDEARDAVTSLAVRGAEIVAGSVDGRVRGYDVRMGRVVTDVVGASVTSLGLSRDAKALLVGSLDSTVRLMDRETGACLRAYSDPARRNEDLRVQAVLGGREKYVVAGDELANSSSSNGAGTGTSGSGTGLGAAVPPEGGAGGLRAGARAAAAPTMGTTSTTAAGGETDYGSNSATSGGEGRVWVWDLLTGKLVTRLAVPWGPQGPGDTRRKVAVGRDGREKERKNVVSCLAWRDGGFGDQFCVGGTSGVVTVFGPS